MLFLCLGTAQPAWIWFPVLVLKHHARLVFKPYGLASAELFAAVVSVLENHAFNNLIAAVDCIVGIVRSLLYTAVYNLDDFVTGTKFGVITHMEIP